MSMMMSMMAAQMRVASSAVLWTPLDMATVPQIYLDAQDSTVTDVSGYASAISNLGLMGANGDFSQGTAGSRPAVLVAELNGNRVLSFDGADDVLLGGSTTQKNLLRNVAAAWCFSIYKKRGTDGSAVNRLVFYATRGTDGNQRFDLRTGLSGSAANRPAISVRRLDADSAANLVLGSDFVGAYSMQLGMINYASRLGRLYIDGAVAAENATLTASTGNTSDTASAESLAVGAFYTGGGAADIDLAAVVVSNTQPSDIDIDKLFGWAAHKYGLTASLPAEHPYKTTAPTV